MISPKTTGKDVVRPTSDRVREAIFSILGERVSGASVLDLFAGTGSLGIEALSRGALRAVFVDRSSRNLELVRRNLANCLSEARYDLIRLDLSRKSTGTTLAGKLAGSGQFSLVFLDPPYERNLAEMTLTMIEKSGLLAPEATVIAEERATASLPDQAGRLLLRQSRRYGETGLWFYRFKESPR